LAIVENPSIVHRERTAVSVWKGGGGKKKESRERKSFFFNGRSSGSLSCKALSLLKLEEVQKRGLMKKEG